MPRDFAEDGAAGAYSGAENQPAIDTGGGGSTPQWDSSGSKDFQSPYTYSASDLGGAAGSGGAAGGGSSGGGSGGMNAIETSFNPATNFTTTNPDTYNSMFNAAQNGNNSFHFADGGAVPDDTGDTMDSDSGVGGIHSALQAVDQVMNYLYQKHGLSSPDQPQGVISNSGSQPGVINNMTPQQMKQRGVDPRDGETDRSFVPEEYAGDKKYSGVSHSADDDISDRRGDRYPTTKQFQDAENYRQHWRENERNQLDVMADDFKDWRQGYNKMSQQLGINDIKPGGEKNSPEYDQMLSSGASSGIPSGPSAADMPPQSNDQQGGAIPEDDEGTS